MGVPFQKSWHETNETKIPRNVSSKSIQKPWKWCFFTPILHRVVLPLLVLLLFLFLVAATLSRIFLRIFHLVWNEILEEEKNVKRMEKPWNMRETYSHLAASLVPCIRECSPHSAVSGVVVDGLGLGHERGNKVVEETWDQEVNCVTIGGILAKFGDFLSSFGLGLLLFLSLALLLDLLGPHPGRNQRISRSGRSNPPNISCTNDHWSFTDLTM